MCAKRWALLSLCLLVAPESHGADETGATAIGEDQATATSAEWVLAARIQDAQRPEGVRGDTSKQFDVSGFNGISDQTLEMQFKLY